MTNAKIESELILRHLGGETFIKMSGVKNFKVIDRYDTVALRMELPKNKIKANYLRITLLEDSNYSMGFYHEKIDRKGIKHITIELLINSLDCFKLRETFEHVTGINTLP